MQWRSFSQNIFKGALAHLHIVYKAIFSKLESNNKLIFPCSFLMIINIVTSCLHRFNNIFNVIIPYFNIHPYIHALKVTLRKYPEEAKQNELFKVLKQEKHI